MMTFAVAEACKLTGEALPIRIEYHTQADTRLLSSLRRPNLPS